MTLLGEDNWKLCMKLCMDPFWILPYKPLPLADFNLYPFTVTNHNCDYHTFQ